MMAQKIEQNSQTSQSQIINFARADRGFRLLQTLIHDVIKIAMIQKKNDLLCLHANVSSGMQ